LILLDTSGLYAALNDKQPNHEASRALLAAEPGPRILSPFVLAELDYLVLTRVGVATELDFLDEVTGCGLTLAQLDRADVGEARGVIAQYRDLRIGLTDASIVVLAGRYGTNRVLTLDERHFRALRTPGGDPFVVLPADA
jgi:predicted nucleic acid-binding protein